MSRSAAPHRPTATTSRRCSTCSRAGSRPPFAARSRRCEPESPSTSRPTRHIPSPTPPTDRRDYSACAHRSGRKSSSWPSARSGGGQFTQIGIFHARELRAGSLLFACAVVKCRRHDGNLRTDLGRGVASGAGFGRRASRPLAAAPAGPRADRRARARAAHRDPPRSPTAPRG